MSPPWSGVRPPLAGDFYLSYNQFLEKQPAQNAQRDRMKTLGISLRNFPSQPTSFIGREKEIKQIRALLDDDGCRLLTLVGPGGIGKTRLAIEAAAAVAGDYADGAWYVPLQSVERVENILPTVATILGVQSYQGREPADLLFDFLENKHLLLVMDNFEQLVEGGQLLGQILDSAPQVKILVTSRTALNLPWEWLVQVEGLPYPAGDSTETLKAYSAVALFEERARQVRSSFSAKNEAACVIRICRMVGGMPLGLELAAAWLRGLSCADIAREIERDLDFLSSTRAGIEDRHRSMRTIFERSWRLLTPEERDVLMKLSVFRGGFDREAAQVVTGSSWEALTALVDHAFVRLNASGRYEIHELLRQFAREKLRAMPKIGDQVRDLHCDHYASFLVQREQRLREQRSNRAVMEILEEIDNVRTAWTWAIEGRKVGQLQKALWPIGSFYDIQNWYREGISALERVVEILSPETLPREKGALRGLALVALANLLRQVGQFNRARALLDEAESILRPLGSPSEMELLLDGLFQIAFNQASYEEAHKIGLESLAHAKATNDAIGEAFGTWKLSMVLRIFGQYRESMRLKKEAVLYFRRIDNHLGLGAVLGDLGEIAQILGDYQAAKSYIEEGLVYLIALDHRWSLGHQYEYLGRVLHAMGEFVEAKRNLTLSLDIAREVGDPRRITFAQIGLGDLAISSGEFEEAQGYFGDALELSIANSQRWQRAWSLLGLGKSRYGQGDFSGASQYLEESLALCRELGWKLGVARTHNALGEVAVATADDASARRSFRRALEIGLEVEVDPLLLGAVAGVGRLLAQGGELPQGVKLLAQALDHPASHADTKNAASGALAELESQLSQSDFNASVQKGKSLDLEQTAAGLLNSLEAGETAAGEQPLADPLTARELEVLVLVAAGQSNREIARELVIALGTVKTHVHNICGKLNAPNRVKAAARARELGLL